MNRMSQDARPRTYQVPDNLAWIDGADWGMGEELYLTIVPDGRTVLLKDTARLIWLVAARGGDVVNEVARTVGLPAVDIEPQVAEFLPELLTRGLLTLHKPEPPRTTSSGIATSGSQ